MERPRGNGHKLLLGKFQLDIRGKFFTVRTVNHWDTLPGGVVDLAALGTSKVHLERVLGHLV